MVHCLLDYVPPSEINLRVIKNNTGYSFDLFQSCGEKGQRTHCRSISCSGNQHDRLEKWDFYLYTILTCIECYKKSNVYKIQIIRETCNYTA